MARHFIGIDIDGKWLRAVVMEKTGKDEKVKSIVQRQLADDSWGTDLTNDLFGALSLSSTRIAMAVPAAVTFSRLLSFPFSERKKISAALSLELATKLPCDLDEYLVCAGPASRSGEGYRSLGLAVTEEKIAALVEPFDSANLPLRQLGVAPFVYAGRFTQAEQSSAYVEVRHEGVNILLTDGDQPLDYRFLLHNPADSTEELAVTIGMAVNAMRAANQATEQPLLIFGAGLSSELHELLKQHLPDAIIPDERFDEKPLPTEFLPALALARCAAAPGDSINLRQGRFAFRGSLAPFRKQLIAAATLIGVAVIALISGSWLAYNSKAATVKELNTQMEQVYRQTFPQAPSIPKDVVRHMSSRLNEAYQQRQQIGGLAAAPLPVLTAVSRALPEGTETVISELMYDTKGLRLAGQAGSFEAIDRLAANLEKEGLFSASRISDAKTNLDGKRVSFRIDIDIVTRGAKP